MTNGVSNKLRMFNAQMQLLPREPEYLIPENTTLPGKIYEYEKPQKTSVVPIAVAATGTMGSLTLGCLWLKQNLKNSLNILEHHKLENITRHVSLNDEIHQAVYQIVQAPCKKTMLAGCGVMVATVLAFIGKNLIDGTKEIWVNKQEANIKKDLQEKLIAVETQSFSGKMRIIRSMLAEKARLFKQILSQKNQSSGIADIYLSFMGKNKQKKEDIETKTDYGVWFALAGGLAASIALGYFCLKNLSKGKEYLEQYDKRILNNIGKLAQKAEQTPEARAFLKSEILSNHVSFEKIKHILQEKLKSDEGKKFIDEIESKAIKSVTKADAAVGSGTPRPAFISFINDWRAFLYNWLIDTSNPMFKALFTAITSLTALGYGGKSFGEAVKEVQVKKYNAQIELDLQQRLVSTELRNFKAKKDSSINPLIQEFKAQVKAGRSRHELESLAASILTEIKTGAPYVYS